MIYLARIVLHLALEVSVLVSVLWQDQDEDTNFQNRSQGQGRKKICLEAASRWGTASKHHITAK